MAHTQCTLLGVGNVKWNKTQSPVFGWNGALGIVRHGGGNGPLSMKREDYTGEAHCLGAMPAKPSFETGAEVLHGETGFQARGAL